MAAAVSAAAGNRRGSPQEGDAGGLQRWQRRIALTGGGNTCPHSVGIAVHAWWKQSFHPRHHMLVVAEQQALIDSQHPATKADLTRGWPQLNASATSSASP